MVDTRFWHEMRNAPKRPVHTQALVTVHKSPAKTWHDAVRAMHHEIKKTELRTRVTQIELKLKSLNLVREELLRIDGYYRDSDCNMVSEDELHLLRIADKNGIAVTAFNLAPKNLTYIRPEKYVDMIDSVGEQGVRKGMSYPNLHLKPDDEGVSEGTVLRDPKIRHVDPVLRKHEWF